MSLEYRVTVVLVLSTFCVVVQAYRLTLEFGRCGPLNRVCTA